MRGVLCLSLVLLTASCQKEEPVASVPAELSQQSAILLQETPAPGPIRMTARQQQQADGTIKLTWRNAEPTVQQMQVGDQMRTVHVYPNTFHFLLEQVDGGWQVGPASSPDTRMPLPEAATEAQALAAAHALILKNLPNNLPAHFTAVEQVGEPEWVEPPSESNLPSQNQQADPESADQ